MDVKNIPLQFELEEIFKRSFLESAKLYRAAAKVKLPFEDAKLSTTLYRGSLSEQTRKVEEIADYHIFKEGWPGEGTAREYFQAFGVEAAHVIDGLIRLENSRTLDHDVRNTSGLRVIDIFDHSDGRRNLQIIVIKDGPPTMDPGAVMPAWIAYRFYFAAANVRTEYKPAQAALHNTPNK